MAEQPPSEQPACANCFRALPQPPPPRFCPHCGQETVLRPPTLGEFAQQFGGAFFSTEGALWRTLALLLTRPGELTRQYLAGRRKHYVLPLRLYLTISLVVLLGARAWTAVGGAQDGIQIETDAVKGSIELGVGRTGLKDGKFYCDNLPTWFCRRLERRFDVDAKVLQREMAEVSTRFVGNLGGAMFVLLPAFALFMKLAYWNRGRRYTEHLVFALHLHAFWFIAFAVAIGALQWISLIALLAMPVYALLAMRRVYGGRWRWLVARALVVSLLYLMVLLLALVGVAAWSLLF